jgi:hypothetical protein
MLSSVNPGCRRKFRAADECECEEEEEEEEEEIKISRRIFSI